MVLLACRIRDKMVKLTKFLPVKFTKHLIETRSDNLEDVVTLLFVAGH